MDKKIDYLSKSKINFMEVNTVYQDDEETVQDLLSNFTDSYDNIVNTVNEIKKVTDNINTNIDKKVETVTNNHKKDIDNQISNLSNNLINDISSYKTNINNKITKHENDTIAELQKIKSDTNRTYDKYKTDIDLNLAIHKNNVNNVINTNQQELENIINTGKEELRTDLEEHKEELLNVTNDFIETVNKDIFEDSKIDFFGKEHDKLNTRLNTDFDNVHQRINESELLPYEGTSIKADNSYYGLQKDTVIKGRTLQNCIKDVANLHHSKGSYNNEWITLQQETAVDVSYSYLVEDILLKPNTEYTMFLEIKENTILDKDSSYTYHFTLSKNGLGYGDFACNLNSAFGIGAGTTGLFREKFTYREVNGNKGIKIGTGGFVAKSTTGNNGKIVFRIFILEGDHTQTPLEELPFIEGIESVGDKSRNLCDNSKNKQCDLAYDTGLELSTNPNCLCTDFIPYNPNKNYTYKVHSDINITASYRFYDINKNYVGATVTTNVAYCRLRIGHTQPLNTDTKFQLEEGTQATPYQEYYDGYKISGKSCGKNLFNDFLEYGLWSWENKEKKDSTSYIKNKKLIQCKPNTEYIFNGNAIGNFEGNLAFYDKDKKYLNKQIYKFQRFTTPDNAYFFAFHISVNFVNDINGSVQLEESSIVTPYEPYKESNYSYILNEPLRSLPNGVCDTIDLETGVLTRRVGKVELNGSENWTLWKENTTVVCFYTSIKNKKSHHNILCDKFGLAKSYNDDIEGITTSGGVTTFGVAINKNKITSLDVDGFKQWLQANLTTVIYELAEPTIEQLSPQQLKSFDTTTHIISDNKLMPIVSTKIPSNVQAIISTLRLENSDLKNNVEMLTVENEELKETINTQNDLIDTSLCATDELYCMIENLLPEVLE